MTPDRNAVLSRCRQILDAGKIQYLRELENLDEAAAGETKSSAGDKYETGREMIAQSRLVVERNLAETKACLDALDRMAEVYEGSQIVFGALVETTLGWYLTGVSFGEVEMGGNVIRTISLASPLGLALRGRRAGEKIPWRRSSFDILRIMP